MLLVLDTAGCSLDGVSVSGIVRAVAERWHIYRPLPPEDPGDPAAQTITASTAEGRIEVRRPALSHRPLAYHVSKGLVIVSHSAGEVAAELRRRGQPVNVDLTGFFELQLFSTPLWGRSLFGGIRVVRLGERISLDLDGGCHSCESWRPSLVGGPQPRQDPLEETKQVLSRVVADACGEASYLVPLSGGLDSRLLAAFFSQRATCSSFTFGSFGSAEVDYARPVAELLRLPWQYVALQPDYYVTFGRDIALNTGGFLSAMHMHLLASLRVLHSGAIAAVHGFMGDPLAGDHCRSGAGTVGGAWGPAIERIAKNHGVMGGPFSDLLPKSVVEEIQHDLENIASECSSVNPPECLDEFLFLVERQNMIAHIPAALELVMPVVCPYDHIAYRNHFLSLPRHLRFGRREFRRACKDLFPKVFSLPSTAIASSGFAALVGRGERKIRTGVQLISDILTGGRRVVFSRYIYEQHHYVANRLLRPRMMKSAAELEARSGIRASALVRRALSFRRRRPDLAFGVFSLNEVLTQLEFPKGAP